jgi:hypothetical protein
MGALREGIRPFPEVVLWFVSVDTEMNKKLPNAFSVCSHRTNAPKVLRSFFKSDRLPISRPQAHRRFFPNRLRFALSFCAFLVKESGVTD